MAVNSATKICVSVTLGGGYARPKNHPVINRARPRMVNRGTRPLISYRSLFDFGFE